MAWTSNKPADSDLLKDIARQWRGDKTSLTSYLDSFVYWSSTGSAGVPIDTGRIRILERSELSTTGRAELIYLSDEDRLIYQDSSGSNVPIGGKGAVVSVLTLAGTSTNQPCQQEDCKVVVEYGSATTTNGNLLIANVTFTQTYAVPPFVMVTSSTTQPTVSSAASYNVGIDHLTTSGFSCIARWNAGSSSTVNDIKWYWRSCGTVAI